MINDIEHNNIAKAIYDDLITKSKEEIIDICSSKMCLINQKDKEIERLNSIITELKNVYRNVINRCFEIGNNDLAEYLLAQLDVNTIKVEELKELKENK